jgi:hypothetical protein
MVPFFVDVVAVNMWAGAKRLSKFGGERAALSAECHIHGLTLSDMHSVGREARQ